MALNIGTSFQYNTSIGSQQTSMLAGQDALGASSGGMGWGGAMGAMSIIGSVGQLAGTYYSAKMANSNSRYQSQIADLNAGHQTRMSSLDFGHRTTMAGLDFGHRTTMAGLDFGHRTTMAGVRRQSAGIQSRAIEMQGKSQKLELDLKATVSDINARLAETAAQTTLLTGQRQEQGQRLKTAQLKSTQRNRMAARGIDLRSDTALNILTTTDVMGEIDAQTIEANAVRAAWGYRTEGVNYQIDAAMATANGNMAVANANANAAANTASANVPVAEVPVAKVPVAQNMPVAARGGYTRVSTGAAIASSLLGSATNIASTYYTLNKAGAFS
jgi:hypothetical protein